MYSLRQYNFRTSDTLTEVDKKMKKRLDDATLSVVTVRRIIGKLPMNAQAKFNIGVLLHSRNTNEDGLGQTSVRSWRRCDV